MSQRASTSNGSIAALSGRPRHSSYALRHQQAIKNLTHLLFIAYLANSSPIVDSIVSCLATISRLRGAKSSKIESLLLLDGLAPLLNNIKDLLLLALYANRYTNSNGNNIARSIWSKIKVKHYKPFCLTGSYFGT